jgi:glycosyltransferase involved in cell wall biosynthesis
MVKPIGGLGEQFKQIYTRLKDRVDFYIMGFPEEKPIDNYCNVANLFPMIEHNGLNTISNQINYFYSSATCPEKPDIVHTLDYTTYVAGVFASRFWRVPLIASMNLSIQELGKQNIHYCRDYSQYDGEAIHNTIEVNELLGLFCANKIIHVSKAYSQKPSFSNFKDKEVIIPNGIDIKYWNTTHKPYQFKGKNKIKVVYIGRFAEMKGIKNLCLAEIPENIDLFFVGDGRGGESSCYNMVMQKCNNKNIFHIDFAYDDEKRDIMKSADAIIMPSIHEPFGIVGLEALASKTLLISSFQDGISEYLSEDVGIYCGTEVDTIESSLYQLLSMGDKEKSIKIDKGYKIAQKFDWDNISEKYYNLYENSKNLPFIP